MARRNTYGDGGLFKRADGMWIGTVEIPSADGKRRQQRVSSKSRNECKRKRDELRAEIKMGIMPISATTTLGAWLDYWLKEIKKPNVRPSSYDYYEEAVRLHIKPHLATKKLKYLSAEEVRFMLTQANTPANAQRAHKTLRLALKDAIAEGLLRTNVTDAVAKPEHTQQGRTGLSAGDAKAALRAAITLEEAGTGLPLATYWATAFLTGTRPGELLGLEWDRVDLDAGLIDLAWQLQEVDRAHGCGEPDNDDSYPCGKKRPSFCPQTRWDLPAKFEYRECRGRLMWTRPKSEAGTRIVPVVAPVIAMLQQHQAAGGPNSYNLVWHRPDGNPLDRGDYSASWRQVLDAAGLPTKLVPYTSRHSTATLLQELGVPEETRMAIMGQSSAAAHRNYIHVSQDQSRLALGKLERLLALE
jgi:integrase